MRTTYLSGSPGRALLGAALAAVTLASTACASLSRKEKGAAMDAAALGVIGNNTGSTSGGTILGDGDAAGGSIGYQMDQQAKELQVEMPDAVVERVGEGIQVTFTSGLLFGFDSDAIRPDAGASLRTLAASLKKYPNTELLIVGHTDASGTTEYNQHLSARRATSASSYLTRQGVESSRMHTSGKGELEAVATNGTQAGRQTNRRIAVTIYAAAQR